MYESCFFFFDLKTGECASWVQAWGSVLAIFAAAAFTWWQHQLDLKRDQEAEKAITKKRIELAASAASGIRAALLDALAVATASQGVIMLGSRQHLRLTRTLERIDEVLKSIPRDELPNIKVAGLILDVELAVVRGRSLLDSISGIPTSGSKQLEELTVLTIIQN